MSQPSLFAYPNLLKSTPKERVEGSDHIAGELSVTAKNVSRVMTRFGVTEISVHLVRVAEHPDIGCAVLTAHLGRVI
jgi:hypothetical protein